ncbi:MAG: hypothetical protein ACOX9E_02025 [Lentisphaeria bacterium]|jgi:epoxyqueuosine reductase
MLTAKDVKKMAREYGADLVGIASMDRFEGAPKERDPRYIFPEAKSCVVMAFRIPRGYFRGIEEGTYFSAYTSMGYAGINEVFAPAVIRRLCCFIEDHGYEAVPLPNIYLRANVDWYGPVNRSIPVREGLPEPDIMIDMRVAAFVAGLGQFGWSKVFLTPEFGPMQRFAAMLTDYELEPDPIFTGKICDRCMRCAKACTGNAISTTESDRVTIAGHVCEFAKIDLQKCGYAYRGGNSEYNPFLKDGQRLEDFPGGQIIPLYMRHQSALEGARGCMRECYVHLEETGRLTHKFATKFRKRKPWKIDRSKAKPEAGADNQEGYLLLGDAKAAKPKEDGKTLF